MIDRQVRVSSLSCVDIYITPLHESPGGFAGSELLRRLAVAISPFNSHILDVCWVTQPTIAEEDFPSAFNSASEGIRYISGFHHSGGIQDMNPEPSLRESHEPSYGVANMKRRFIGRNGNISRLCGVTHTCC